MMNNGKPTRVRPFVCDLFVCLCICSFLILLILMSVNQDLWTVDIRRFAPFHNNRTIYSITISSTTLLGCLFFFHYLLFDCFFLARFLRERSAESLGLHYALSWPRRELV